MTTETLETKFEAEAALLVTAAESLIITTPEQNEAAADRLKLVKSGMKAVLDFFKPLKQAQDEAKRKLLDAEKKALAPYEKAEGILKGRMLAWAEAEERRVREEQKRAEEEARRQEEARRAAEAKQAEAEAAALDAAGHTEEACAALDEAKVIAETPIQVYTTPLPPAPVKPKGIAVSVTWSASVEDKLALVKYVAANPSFLHLLDANQTALNALARSLKDAMQIPGVKAVGTKGLSARAS